MINLLTVLSKLCCEKIPSRLIKCFHYPKAVKKIDKLGNTRVVTEIRIKSVKIPRLST